MEDMEYEFLLRRVYQCGRDYRKGADADIYREMDRAHSNISTRAKYESHQERRYEFRKTFSVVREYVTDAIQEGLKQVRYKTSEPEIKELERMISTLDYRFYDKKEQDRIIIKAAGIFDNNGLKENQANSFLDKVWLSQDG